MLKMQYQNVIYSLIYLRKTSFYRTLLIGMKIKQTVLIIAVLIGLGSFLSGPMASAAKCAGVDTAIISCDSNGADLGTCSDGSYPNNGQCNLGTCADKSMPINGMCYKADHTTPSGKKYTPPTIPAATYTPASSITKTGIWMLLVIAINIITYGIGLAGVAGIVWGSIMYTTASGKPEQVKKANMIIANTVLGLIVYAAAYAFLNFIIPGGLIG